MVIDRREGPVASEGGIGPRGLRHRRREESFLVATGAIVGVSLAAVGLLNLLFSLGRPKRATPVMPPGHIPGSSGAEPDDERRLKGVVVASVESRMARVASLLRLAMLAAASWLALGEIDRLISGAVGPDRLSHSLTALVGPDAVANTSAWAQWASSGRSHEVGGWIAASVIIDGFFVLAYALALVRLTRRATPPDLRHREDKIRWTNVSRVLLFVLLGVEAVEAIALLLGASALLGASWVSLQAVAGAEAIIATAKFLVIAVLIVALLRNRGTRTVLWRILSNSAKAVWVHRLTAVLVIALIVLSCIPSDGVLNQLPDIQRQWLDSPGQLYYAGAAGVTLGIAAYGSFLLGRQRARASYDIRVRRITDSDRLPSAKQWVWWLITAVAWLVMAVATVVGTVLSGGSWSHALSYFSAEGVLVLVGPLLLAASVLIDRFAQPAERMLGADTDRAVYSWVVGDVLAVLVLCVGGLGLVRSFAGPIFLGQGSAPTYGLFLLGAAGALLWPGVLVPINRRGAFTPGEPTWTHVFSLPVRAASAVGQRFSPVAQRGESKSRSTRAWLLSLLVLAGMVILAAIWWPTLFAQALGGVGVTVLLLTAWGVILGAFTVVLQDYRLLAVFRALRLKAAPVLTLAIVVPLAFTVVVATQGGGDAAVHAVRVPYDRAPDASQPVTQPSSTEDLLLARIKADHCVATTASSRVVKPVVVVAAEGGGIRAAYLTTKALNALWSKSGCLQQSVLLSSGVSGGSVGLALTSVYGAKATGEVAGLADPRTVSSDVTGLLAGDLVAGDFGIRAPTVERGNYAWTDRAALVEDGWISASPKLGNRFNLAPTDGTGYAIFNSTDARSKCRILVSQLPGGAGNIVGQDGSPVNCSQSTVEPAMSGSLSAIYGQACLRSLDWAGAAMLSARFPFVTPAGRLPSGSGSCSDGKLTQLIDGGYAEGSALGTVADLSATISAAIRRYNATLRPNEPYAVPILLFLRNSSGFDLAPTPTGVTPEPFVPLVGYSAEANQATQKAWIQRITSNFRHACPPAPGSCLPAQKQLNNQVIVVAPFTLPTVEPPLGWALSDLSEKSLDNAVRSASSRNDGFGYGRLTDLTGLRTHVQK